MRRAVPAILGTVAGLAALLGYKTGASPRRVVAAPSSSASSASSPSVSTATTPPTTAPAGPRTIAGSDVYTKFGDVQVQATVQNGRLIDVTPLQLPFDHQRSQVISDRAAPILRAEALRAQGANIDTISGATYTSDAYAQSLQAALDRARGGT